LINFFDESTHRHPWLLASYGPIHGRKKGAHSNMRAFLVKNLKDF